MSNFQTSDNRGSWSCRKLSKYTGVVSLALIGLGCLVMLAIDTTRHAKAHDHSQTTLLTNTSLPTRLPTSDLAFDHANGRPKAIRNASDASEAASAPSPLSVPSPNYVIVSEHDSLGRVMSALESRHADIAIVSRHPESSDTRDVIGVVTVK